VDLFFFSQNHLMGFHEIDVSYFGIISLGGSKQEFFLLRSYEHPATSRLKTKLARHHRAALGPSERQTSLVQVR
jgi:hypothetical protein